MENGKTLCSDALLFLNELGIERQEISGLHLALLARHHACHHRAKLCYRNATDIVLGNIMFLQVFQCGFHVCHWLLGKICRAPSFVPKIRRAQAKVKLVPISESLEKGTGLML